MFGSIQPNLANQPYQQRPMLRASRYQGDSMKNQRTTKWTVFALGLAAIALLFPARTSWAQLAPANDAGVSMGHIHLNVADIDASRNFYLEIGGAPASMGPTQ